MCLHSELQFDKPIEYVRAMGTCWFNKSGPCHLNVDHEPENASSTLISACSAGGIVTLSDIDRDSSRGRKDDPTLPAFANATRAGLVPGDLCREALGFRARAPPRFRPQSPGCRN